MHDGLRLAFIGAVLLALGCSSSSSSGKTDAGNDAAGNECADACLDGQVCRYSNCVPDPAPCATTDDCGGDFYCDLPAGECLPWGVGPGGNRDDECTREVVAGVFFPDVQCEWLGPPAGDAYPNHFNVLGSPVVANFRAFGDPELGRPSIVFISYNCDDGGSQSCQGSDDDNCFGVIRVIDGRNCEQQASIEMPHALASTSLALGDLTGDSIPEIVAATVGGGVAAWQRNSTGGFDPLFASQSTFGSGVCNWAAPSLYDLNDDGVSEILLFGAVFDNQGNEITTTLGVMNGDLSTGAHAVVADVDRDMQVELITGTAIYGWSTTNNEWELEQVLGPTNAHTAVADFGTFGADPGNDDRTTLDGIAEIAMVYRLSGNTDATVEIYTITGRSIFSSTLPGAGGPPTIADFDGDGRAELAAAGLSDYRVYDMDCLGTPDVASCPTMTTNGILWSQPSQDASSNRTGSSVFDFEGDGIAEAVYADECYTRVYDGRTGDVLYSRNRTSCTWYENPIIADTDADFGAEIVIPSNLNCTINCDPVDPIFDGIRCHDESDCPGMTTCGREMPADPTGFCRCTMDTDCGGDGFICLDRIAGPSPAGKVCRASHPGPNTVFGIRVIGDQLGRWVNTRPIWNQHAYSVTHVDNAGRVTKTSDWVRNWDDPMLNNFRQNSPGDGAGAGLMPDLTIRQAKVNCAQDGAEISIEVCNRGTEPVADGIQISIHDGTSTVCTTPTDRALYPGLCTTVYCTYPNFSGPNDFTITVDDDGTGAGSHTECREGNNTFVLPDVTCP